MSTVTLEAIEAKQTELSKLIAQFKADATKPMTWLFPEVSIELAPGERYAGAVLTETGHIDHHLVLMAARPEGKLQWQAAMDWAASVGGDLPSRQEQALLYANCKPHLKQEWHWSNETHENDASYAWDCLFSNGSQDYYHKSFEGSAVAVRRIR
jgi:hypothetical protein